MEYGWTLQEDAVQTMIGSRCYRYLMEYGKMVQADEKLATLELTIKEGGSVKRICVME